MISYRLVRSARKTLAVQITPQGEVVVRAPKRLSQRRIDAFLEEKQGWIATHQQEVLRRMNARPKLVLAPGGSLPLLGRWYPVALWEKASAFFDGQRFFLPREETLRTPALVSCYRELARADLSRRVAALTGAGGAVAIGGAKGRWGSCSAKGELRFSWRLMAAPEAAVDYVAAHEVCHRRELNHSPKFWALVEQILPDYRERQAMLKQPDALALLEL